MSSTIHGPRRGRRKKIDMNTEIKFQHFIDYADNIDDPYWKNIFQMMGRGGFPSNFYVDNTGFIIQYRFGSKTPKILTISPSADAPSKIMAFFNKYGGMESELDNKLKKTKYEQIIPETWKEIPKSDRIKVLENYNNFLKNTMKLNSVEFQNLKYVVNIGVLKGYFDNNRIIVHSGNIIKIDGLLFDNIEREFCIDSTLYKSEKNIQSITIEELSQINLLEITSKPYTLQNILDRLFKNKSSTVEETPSTNYVM